MADRQRRRDSVVVTSAQQSREEVINAKRRHYAIAMVSRIALIGVAVAFLRPWPWALYPAMLFAMVLPYFAVVLANNVNRKAGQVEPFDRDETPTAITSGRTIDHD